MLIKIISIQDHDTLMKKTGFNLKKVKYLRIILTNMNLLFRVIILRYGMTFKKTYQRRTNYRAVCERNEWPE